MNRKLVLGHLWWKEVRQVLPLVWMQLALGLCFQLLFLLHPDRTYVPRFLVFAGMPSLFAAGVGVLLVGQEKERRTLDWLRSLPVASRDLVAVKLATGFASLVAVWCLNSLLLAILVLPSGRWPVPSPADSWVNGAGWEYLWPLQSVFLLVAGFATAWLFRSSLVALLALVPLALLPGAIAFGLNHLVRWPSGTSSILNDPAPWMTAVALLVSSLPLLLVGWRRGVRSLAPERFGRPEQAQRSSGMATVPGEAADQRGAGTALRLFRPTTAPDIWSRPLHAPAAMLSWQFVRQNRVVLAGIGLMLLAALGLLATTPSLSSAQPAWAALLGLLAACWLGVLAFAGDGVQDRIRFLADRGVSPAKVWWTRHAPPLSLLAMALALMVLCLPAHVRSAQLPAAGVLLFAGAVLFAYTVSQAVGQVFRSSTIAAIAAPAAAWGLAAYDAALVAVLGVPYWLLALCAMLPWLATFLLMRRWMDGRWGWGFWGAHAGFLAAGMVLPLVPVGLTVVSRPTMPAEVRRQLTAEAETYGAGYTTEPRELVLRFHDPELPKAPAQDRRAEGRIVCEQLAHDLAIAPGPIRFVPHVMVYLLGEARLARMALEQDGDAQANRERYRRILSLIGTMVERLRLSWRLFDQDGADLIEIWMVRELAGSEAASWLEPEVYGRLVRAVSDDAARNAARRRALVMSWAAYRSHPDALNGPLGGYAWRGDETSILCRVSTLLRRRDADYLTWRMLQRLEECEPATGVQRTRELARHWGVPELYYGLGPGGEFLRADKPAEFAMPVEGFFRNAPGSQWHAGWERAARELADRLGGQGEVANPR
ncbi:MAG TPA: hypothetical protein PLF81_08925 [Candidatus Anammoximicrobium sp.]|nr:hypothetical protein [Candidatus Anammoximicrobium sp.]